MKKRLLILLAVLVFPQLCWGQTIFDVIYHSISSTPAYNFINEAIHVGKMGVQQATNVQGVITSAKTEATNMQTAVVSSFNDIVSGAVLSKSILPALDGSVGDVQSKFFGKKINKVQTKKIAKKFKKLFLTYDSQKHEDVQFVNENRERFFQKNIMDINAAATVLLDRLANELKPEIEKTKKCAEGDGSKCGIPSTDGGGKNEMWYTYASTLEQYDRLMKMMETVAALKARLTAIQAMKMLTPAVASEAEKKEDEKNTGEDILEDKQKTEEKTALNNIFRGFGFNHTEAKMAFAQVMYNSPAVSLSQVETQAKTTQAPAQQMINKVINFVTPEESENEHPLLANESKLEELNEINDVKDTVDSAAEVHNYLKELRSYRETALQIRKMQEDYQKVLIKLQGSEKCALKYMEGYFKNPTIAWSGINLLKNVERHDLRKGISGWAVEAFETAKAAETSTVTTDDIEQHSMSDEEAQADKDDADLSKAKKRISKMSVSPSQSKLEAAQEETRRLLLLSWQIGAEASKIFGKDPKKWGITTGKSMIWTDTKRFYNQYLQRKYENIKAHLQRYTKEDILAIVISKLNKKTENIEDTKYQKKRRETLASAEKEKQDEIKKMKVSMQAYDESVYSELESLMRQRKALVEKIDEISSKIKKSSDDLADMRQVSEDKAAEQVEGQLLPKAEFPDPEKDEDDAEAKKLDKVPYLASEEETQKLILSKNAEILDPKKTEELEKEIDKNKALRSEYEKRLKVLDEQIDVAKLTAQGKRKGENTLVSAINLIKDRIEQSNENDIQEYARDVDANLDNVIQEVLGVSTLMFGKTKNTLVEAAEKALKDINMQVTTAVDASYQQMMALGDELYKPSSHEKLVQIHQQMINKLKAVSLVYAATGIIKFEEAAILEDLLSVDSSAETEGFFVGLEPKERDLKAPYKIPNFDLPPVREVFHFDATDFKAVKPRNERIENREISASEFLNYGGDIPEIWQYMLKDDAFIESQYNLKEALSGGCENIAFARGGIMPCIAEGSKTIIDVDGEGNYIRRTDLKAGKLPTCFLIGTKKNKPYHIFMDSEVIFREPVLVGFGAGNKIPMEKQDCEYSELGMLLEADENNNLSFKPLAYELYMTLLDKSNDSMKKLSVKDKNKIAAAYHAALSRNQIGDFLHHAESESNARKNLEEAQKQYESQKEELKKKLKEFGFTPTEKFDLANDNDYNNATTQIKKIKDQLVSKADKALNAVNVINNKPAQQQKEIMKKMLSLMQKDKEGNLNISDISSDLSNPDEELKRAKADSAVVDKLKNSLKEKEKEYTDIDQIFCANYGK